MVARTLVHSASLDWRDLESDADDLLTVPENQEFWGFRLHALAQQALTSGSPVWRRQLLEEARNQLRSQHLAGMLQPVTGGWVDALLVADEINLALSVGQGVRAKRLLDSAADHPVLRPVRARFCLLRGDNDGAMLWAGRGLGDTRTLPTDLIELLLIRAVARHRTDDQPSARGDLRQVLRMVRATHNLNALRTVNRAELVDLVAQLHRTSDVLENPALADTDDLYPDLTGMAELTERESLLLRLMDEGHSLQAMAERLFVSVNTLKSQRRTLYQKLGVTSREQAVIRARDTGWLVEEPSDGWLGSLQVDHGRAEPATP